MGLDRNQVTVIEDEINKASLAIESLRKELADHICCEVEDLMEKGSSFEDAFEQVKHLISVQSLKEIEENTRMLTDKKYYEMKTSMKLSANVSLACIGAGTVMKILSVPGSNVVLVSGFVLLCLAFLPWLMVSEKKLLTRTDFLFRSSAIASAITFAAGILLKAMEWGGANGLLLTSYFLILVISFPLLFAHTRKQANGGGLAAFGVVSVMVVVLASMFKMFNLPGAAIMMIGGAVMAVTIFLPMYTYRQFRQTNSINGEFIFIVIFSMYAVTMTMVMSFHSVSVVQNLVYNH